MSTTTTNTIALPKYSDVLKDGKSFLEKAVVPLKAMQAKKAVEMAILGIEESQAKLAIELTNSFDAVPFDAKKVYGLQNQWDLLERERAFYAKLLVESF